MITIGFVQKGKGLVQSTVDFYDNMRNHLYTLDFTTNDKLMLSTLLSIMNNATNLQSVTKQQGLRILSYARQEVKLVVEEGLCNDYSTDTFNNTFSVMMSCNSYMFEFKEVADDLGGYYEFTIYYINPYSDGNYILEVYKPDDGTIRVDLTNLEKSVKFLLDNLSGYLDQMQKMIS